MKKNTNDKLTVTHRACLVFTGYVQGVGFRYTVEKIALEIGLLGWVKNLPSNQVEIVCEGTKENIELLVHRIKKSALGPYIKKMSCEWEKPTGKFKDFRIEFYY